MKEKLEDKLNQIYEIYPYLHRIFVPFKDCFPIIIEGYLVTKQECKEYKVRSKEDAEFLSFYARIFIYENYEYVGTEVFDLYKKIDINFIIEKYPKHFHFKKIDTDNGNLLCTHINGSEVYSNNIILDNINSAHYYYLNYINLKNGRPFNMKEYSHGQRGREEFIKERNKMYGKKKL